MRRAPTAIAAAIRTWFPARRLRRQRSAFGNAADF
jgi:hypothetical protein